MRNLSGRLFSRHNIIRFSSAFCTTIKSYFYILSHLVTALSADTIYSRLNHTLNINVAVLTWNKPFTLLNTLILFRIYCKLSNINPVFYVLSQEKNIFESIICNLVCPSIYTVNNSNLGIGPGVIQLLSKLPIRHSFIFLENDWIPSLPIEIFKKRLFDVICFSSISEGFVLVKLRNTAYPGYPCHSKIFIETYFQSNTSISLLFTKHPLLLDEYIFWEKCRGSDLLQEDYHVKLSLNPFFCTSVEVYLSFFGMYLSNPCRNLEEIFNNDSFRSQSPFKMYTSHGFFTHADLLF